MLPFLEAQNHSNLNPESKNPQTISKLYSMEKRRKAEGVSCETQLPEAIIQHIQSFLAEKEVAQTTILSKSWHNAWLTRPNLVFDERNFKEYDCDGSKSVGFSKFMKETLQRYQHLNLKIDSFKLSMESLKNVDYSVANELVVEAIKMGATDINFEMGATFVFPREVFESESLDRLSVTGCKIKGGAKLNCSRLKYLYLSQVVLEGDLFWDVISSCPLIEDLELRQCRCWIKVENFPKKKMLLLSLPKQNVSPGVNGPINLFELHKLKKLFLEKIKICGLFFIDFSSRFPCLKDLNVHECTGYNDIIIYSQSLEFISVVRNQLSLKLTFDVPNLRKFCFSGNRLLPSLSFPNSCNWVSDVAIECRSRVLSAGWFFKLKRLLTNLSMSKVSLFLRSPRTENTDKGGNAQGLPKPFVENLTIEELWSLDCCAVLDSLFRYCRPVFVTICWRPNSSTGGERIMEFLEIIYERLMQQMNLNCCTKNHGVFCQDDLEEVSVGVFDDAVSRWRMLSWKSLLDASPRIVAEQRIRFHLRWGQKSAAFR